MVDNTKFLFSAKFYYFLYKTHTSICIFTINEIILYDEVYLSHFHFPVIQNNMVDVFSVSGVNDSFGWSIVGTCTVTFKLTELSTKVCFQLNRCALTLLNPF